MEARGGGLGCHVCLQSSFKTYDEHMHTKVTDRMQTHREAKNTQKQKCSLEVRDTHTHTLSLDYTHCGPAPKHTGLSVRRDDGRFLALNPALGL